MNYSCHLLISLCIVTTLFFFAKLSYGWSENHQSPAHPAHQSSTSVGLRSGLCGGEPMCENDVSCSVNHSLIIWLLWNLALSSWNMLAPSGMKKNSTHGKNWPFSLSRNYTSSPGERSYPFPLAEFFLGLAVIFTRVNLHEWQQHHYLKTDSFV